MARTPRPNPITDCPLTAAFAAVGGKWKLIILYWLAAEDRHFAGLKKEMSACSTKVLAQQLQELEADGLVSRTPTGRVPAKVIYALTDYGRSLVPLIEQVRRFGRGHIERARSGSRQVQVKSVAATARAS